MPIRNFEFKARTSKLAELEQRLLNLNPLFKGEDEQTDTYFKVQNGRLKLREGRIENALIYYERSNSASAKLSNVILYKLEPGQALKQILEASLGVKVVVRKIRKIYFIENVKFHFDVVDGLGQFVEVEAIDESALIDVVSLESQCRHYADYFGVQTGDYVSESYSDLIFDKQTKKV